MRFRGFMGHDSGAAAGSAAHYPGMNIASGVGMNQAMH
jgi:hypothetical protein